MKEVVDRSRKNQQMYLAAESGTVEDVCSIEGKLKVPITDSISSNGNTALHVAAAKREGGFLKRILRDEIQLIDVRNLEGSTLLHVAASNGNTDAAKILVEKCPGLLSVKDNEGCTPLDIVLSKPWFKETCHLLLKSTMPDIEHRDATYVGDEFLVNAISYGYFGK
ncbi:putative ankyrin repeat-containing domain-containing protein [Helianthus annuus]|nr:putative ankyrin repeat-containing domain-containing protein [Helianthus annuus]